MWRHLWLLTTVEQEELSKVTEVSTSLKLPEAKSSDLKPEVTFASDLD
jgi:hypothetical protein